MLATLAVDWLVHRGSGRLWALAAVTPFAIGLSYPAVFAAGGVSLVLGISLLQQKSPAREWRAWAAWNVVLVASFLLWFHIGGRVQGAAESDFMGSYWKSSFPPVSQPWRLPFWMLATHASDFWRIPWRAELGQHVHAAVVSERSQRSCDRARHSLGLILMPAALHFVAAAMHRYPYGGGVNFARFRPDDSLPAPSAALNGSNLGPPPVALVGL